MTNIEQLLQAIQQYSHKTFILPMSDQEIGSIQSIQTNWFEIYETFKSKTDDAPTQENLIYAGAIKLSIGELIDEYKFKKTGIIPFLQIILSSKAKEDSFENFLNYVAEILGSGQYSESRLLEFDKATELTEHIDYDEGNEVFNRANELFLAYDLTGALKLYDEAIHIYEKLVDDFKEKHNIKGKMITEGDPMAVAYFNKAKVLVKLGRIEEAFKCQDKAIELDPNNSDYA